MNPSSQFSSATLRQAMGLFLSTYPAFAQTDAGPVDSDLRPLALTYQGKVFYPHFQFATQGSFTLLSAFRDVLASLREGGMSDWEIAFWLTTRNTYLQGKLPILCLQQRDRLLMAIQWELDDNGLQGIG
ncbi:hypothetical protein [Mangrovitalea sediminis]|uniref:hypothetical protein n=1 Tax=Mangrovitalea sediminis TaxID=1982043 RepID=UPI001177D497|nr:hypothetical protein [Mangrovitalea sediminis]